MKKKNLEKRSMFIYSSQEEFPRPLGCCFNLNDFAPPKSKAVGPFVSFRKRKNSSPHVIFVALHLLLLVLFRRIISVMLPPGARQQTSAAIYEINPQPVLFRPFFRGPESLSKSLYLLGWPNSAVKGRYKLPWSYGAKTIRITSRPVMKKAVTFLFSQLGGHLCHLWQGLFWSPPPKKFTNRIARRI